jgi:hypothetical protein
VGADLVVHCWISHGPRHDAPSSDPQPSDHARIGDDDEAPLPGRVIRQDGDRVAVQVELSSVADAVARHLPDDRRRRGGP